MGETTLLTYGNNQNQSCLAFIYHECELTADVQNINLGSIRYDVFCCSRDWPQHGAIEFKGYAARYRPELDLVLRQIDVSIRPQEKVYSIFTLYFISFKMSMLE